MRQTKVIAVLKGAQMFLRKAAATAAALGEGLLLEKVPWPMDGTKGIQNLPIHENP